MGSFKFVSCEQSIEASRSSSPSRSILGYLKQSTGEVGCGSNRLVEYYPFRRLLLLLRLLQIRTRTSGTKICKYIHNTKNLQICMEITTSSTKVQYLAQSF